MRLPSYYTKVVATIGPATSSEKSITKMLKAGVNVIRFNFSHNTQQWHRKIHSKVKKISNELDIPVAILQDLSGPKIRIGMLKSKSLRLRKGKVLILTTDDIIGDEYKVSVNYKHLPQYISKGDTIKINDGKIVLSVLATAKHTISTKVLTGGIISSHKGMNIIGKQLDIPALTLKDRRDVHFGIAHNADFIALSFVKTHKDILLLKRILNRYKSKAHIIAKIETSQAVENFDDILAAADGIMIARGDLAIEVGVERVPGIQQMIIEKCNNIGKPVIVATEMLESMTNSQSPTRAEVADIAHAVETGTDALMLSAETASGKYPIDAIKVMHKVSLFTNTKHHPIHMGFTERKLSTNDAITHSCVRLATNTGSRYIITFTTTGASARLISRFKPNQSIIALTHNKRTARQLLLSYGCIPILLNTKPSPTTLVHTANKIIKKYKLLKRKELITLLIAQDFTQGYSSHTLSIITP